MKVITFRMLVFFLSGCLSAYAQSQPKVNTNHSDVAMDLPGEGVSMSTEDTSRHKIHDLNRMLAMAFVPATVNTSKLETYRLHQLDYALSEGITRTPSGTLWTLWTAGGDNDKAFVVLVSSKDNGETWSEPRVVIDPHVSSTSHGIRSLVANVWVDPRGRLWVFYDHGVGYFDGRAGVWATVCSNPDSDSLVWSEPNRLWHGSALQKPIVTSKGEWLLPVSLWPRTLINPKVFRNRFFELDSLRGANVLVSTDEGMSWHLRGKTVQVPENIHTVDEHILIERNDGSLWMTIRTLEGLWESFSTDDGHTWSAPQKSAIHHANAKHFITRLNSGRLLLIKHGEHIHPPKGEPYKPLPRRKLTAFLSEDDGRTWSGGLMLMEGSGSYPDGVQAEDGTLYLCYDFDRWLSAEIWMQRITEEDILAGKFVSPQSTKEARLVSKATGLSEGERKIRIKHRTEKAERQMKEGMLPDHPLLIQP